MQFLPGLPPTDRFTIPKTHLRAAWHTIKQILIMPSPCLTHIQISAEIFVQFRTDGIDLATYKPVFSSISRSSFFDTVFYDQARVFMLSKDQEHQFCYFITPDYEKICLKNINAKSQPIPNCISFHLRQSRESRSGIVMGLAVFLRNFLCTIKRPHVWHTHRPTVIWNLLVEREQNDGLVGDAGHRSLNIVQERYVVVFRCGCYDYASRVFLIASGSEQGILDHPSVNIVQYVFWFAQSFIKKLGICFELSPTSYGTPTERHWILLLNKWQRCKNIVLSVTVTTPWQSIGLEGGKVPF